MSSKELLFSLTKKDFIVETFRAGGKGGQKQNKTNSGVRIRHPESGAVAESREERSQHQNKKIAFERLIKHYRFRYWHFLKCQEIKSGKTIEEKVKEQIVPENIKVEVKQNGKWVREDESRTLFED